MISYCKINEYFRFWAWLQVLIFSMTSKRYEVMQVVLVCPSRICMSIWWGLLPILVSVTAACYTRIPTVLLRQRVFNDWALCWTTHHLMSALWAQSNKANYASTLLSLIRLAYPHEKAFKCQFFVTIWYTLEWGIVNISRVNPPQLNASQWFFLVLTF